MMVFRINLPFLYTFLCLLALYNGNQFVDAKRLKKAKLSSFSWGNCGSETDPAQVKSLFISPDPIAVPGTVTFNTSFSLTSVCPDDVTISVAMKKKLSDHYINIPCIDNIGSCTYSGICDAWAQICPQYFSTFGIPCNCPIPPNIYSIPNVSIDIDVELPTILDGEFLINGTLNTGSTRIICLGAHITLSG